MKSKLIEITYYIKGLIKPKTEHVYIEDIWEDGDINVKARLYVREKYPLVLTWKAIDQEELG